jgi:uncharacterized protein YndB with AHSA1/START domain
MGKELIVRKSILINVPASKVWDAITNPALTKQYMYNSEVISDWKAGSSIIWKDAESGKVHVKGIIEKIKIGSYLRTKDLSVDAGLTDAEENYSRVVYELKNENGNTLLSVKENNFNGDEKRYKDAEKFWDTVLNNLKKLLE